MICFLLARTMKLYTMEDPFFSMFPMALKESQIDLWQLGFMFAVQKVDARIGKIDI